MNTFNPKLHFQTYHKAEMELLAQNVNNRWFNLALEYALLSHNSTAEEMKGARDFINTLINLAEIDKTVTGNMPVITLNVLGQPPVVKKPEEII
jgi:anaerobic ribonucleoside-triphosphate reductase